ncbi:glycosyltransferase [Paenibacillus sp. YIM B09110]|uniref:glycosyltransferase n=1 Tax=Paenibacillus sp. YIM B09110 TaxID=3126102 RepID=UPI00301E578C
MRKILFLITGFDYAGAENQVVQLCRGLRAKHYNILIVSMIKPVAYLDELKRLGVDIQSLHMNKGVPDPRALLKLRRIVKSFGPDIVHSHLVHANIMARVARLLVKMPVLICTAHNINEGGRLREWMYRITDPLCDLTTNVSQEAVNRYIDIKAAPENKIIYVPNGIDMSQFEKNDHDYSNIRNELGLGGQFVWLAIGRFVPEKDYANMLKAYALIVRSYPTSMLLIAGIGVEREAMEKLSRDLGLEQNVRFLGIRTDIPKLMNAVDAYLMSSKWEGLPIVLLEAAASGLPIVATKVGGNAEVVHHETNGYLVPSENEKELADKMALLMDKSESERRHMGEQGKAYIESHYNMQKIIERWEQLYGEARQGMSNIPRYAGGEQ